MRFPSIQSVVDGFFNVIRRFPLEILSALTSAISLIILIERDTYPQESLDINFIRLALCGWLGLTFFLATTLYAEKYKLSSVKKWSVRLIIIAFLAGYYFSLDPNVESSMIQFAFLIAGAHLLVSFIIFIQKETISSFWEFNKVLFIRILTSGLYSTVLFAGIAIAMGSMDVLFDLSIKPKAYAELALTIYCVFNTIFFLAGVPSVGENENSSEYPKGLRVFTQFVLIPLAIVYLSILLAYELKLIIQWSLPKGLVGSLVLGYAVFGLLAMLLVYPIREQSEHAWIKTFSRWFYLLLVPLIVLLGIAISIRVNAYGITESRYLVILLSLWLTGITGYFIFSKKQNIKIIPVTLCALSFISVWGPQSAVSISKLSQGGRLIEYFDKQGAIENGKLVHLKDNSGEVQNIADHMFRRYGIQVFQPFVGINIDSLFLTDSLKKKNKWDVRQELFNYLGITGPSTSTFEYYSATGSDKPISISGFSRMIVFDASNVTRDSGFSLDSALVKINRDSINLSFDLTDTMIQIVHTADSSGSNYIFLDPADLTIYSKDKQNEFIVTYVYFQRSSAGKFDLQSCRGYLLIP